MDDVTDPDSFNEDAEFGEDDMDGTEPLLSGQQVTVSLWEREWGNEGGREREREWEKERGRESEWERELLVDEIEKKEGEKRKCE